MTDFAICDKFFVKTAEMDDITANKHYTVRNSFGDWVTFYDDSGFYRHIKADTVIKVEETEKEKQVMRDFIEIKAYELDLDDDGKVVIQDKTVRLCINRNNIATFYPAYDTLDLLVVGTSDGDEIYIKSSFDAFRNTLNAGN